MINVTIYNEFVHEKKDEHVANIYPDGIHGAIAEFLNEQDILQAVESCAGSTQQT